MTSIQRRGALLGGLICGLIILAWALARDQNRERISQTRKASARKVFADILSKDVVKLSLTNRSGHYEIERVAPPSVAWRMLMPIETNAESPRLDELVEKLVTLDSLGPIGSNTNHSKVSTGSDTSKPSLDANAFGFSPPGQSVCLHHKTLEAGALKKTCLELGDVNTFDQSVFARRTDDNTIFHVDKSITLALDTDLYALRDKRLVHIEPERVTQVEIRQPGKPFFRLIRHPSFFVLGGPFDARADALAVGELLASLTNLQGARFFESSKGTPSLRTMGLDPPSVEVIVHTGDHQAAQIQVGRIVVDQKPHYFCRNLKESDVVAGLNSDYAYTQFMRSADAFRERHLFPDLKNEDVASIVVVEPGERFELRQKSPELGDQNKNGAWFLHEQSEDTRADSEAVRAFVMSLHALRSEKILREHASAKDLRFYGLHRQKREISFFDRRGTSLGSLYLGKNLESDYVALTTDDRARIDAITNQMARILSSHPDTFRADRRARLTP